MTDNLRSRSAAEVFEEFGARHSHCPQLDQGLRGHNQRPHKPSGGRRLTHGGDAVRIDGVASVDIVGSGLMLLWDLPQLEGNV